jgi:hypothetical protein
MSTIREEIIAAVISALNTGRPSGVPAAERARTIALAEDSIPTILVYPGHDTQGAVGGKRGPLKRHDFEIQIECWAREGSGLTPDQAVDPYLAWVDRCLDGKTLGGLVEQVLTVETNWGFGQGTFAFCLAAVTLIADFHSRTGEPEEKT